MLRDRYSFVIPLIEEYRLPSKLNFVPIENNFVPSQGTKLIRKLRHEHEETTAAQRHTTIALQTYVRILSPEKNK